MRRNGLLVVLVTVMACVGVAVVVVSGTGVLRRAGSSSSPSCLPATLEHSAKLEGLRVDVSPAPGTDTANPDTQISFLGVPVSQVHEVSVVGARSGDHPGRLHGYSQVDGASFLPDTPLDAGEHVAVHAADRAESGARRHHRRAA